MPAIAKTKAQGLAHHYGADAATQRYFSVHIEADVHHARVWRNALAAELAAHPEETQAALIAGEESARALWHALDGVEHARQERATTAA